ncbi:MAG TPA: glycerol-3-phosphate dehydrogenase [Geminicoccus sp.]|jgi:glycerol-3-phosphate dehydrogenase|uniref:glycerol-3-phosphate dehydrogenase n=1 Tax=Geminicoccus sp. TaxID=2024832 RepID=UPI002E310363|nr:glycerol-3-phosphate dehydrogenase [Geminicoccus sp.]HEX2529601.1 glycerol-3-phosphate dehydrogenase [Geminicoccus sp.]
MRDLFDLLVVGGGINGVGIARDAAGRGLSVLLCEKDDLAAHTSSWSSKLIHGGLRYLEYHEFRLVRESLIEREVLLNAAPMLVRPLQFVLPHSPEQRPAWLIRLGLFLYDHLGGRKILPSSGTARLGPTLEGKPLKSWVEKAFYYSDAQVDDSRLVVLNALAARDLGAEIHTRTLCRRAWRDGSIWVAELEDQRTKAVRMVKARVLVNAAGPWVSHFLQDNLALDTRSRVRLVKGSHIVTKRLYDGRHAYILQNDDKRIVFVIPWLREFSLIGTTDIPYQGEPQDVRISPEETRYLCDVVNRYFEQQIGEDDVVWSYSGVRPLYDDASANPSAVTRDYVFDLNVPAGGAPLLSVFGGKITTYRKLAEHAVQKLAPHLAVAEGDWTADEPLPGGDLEGYDPAGFAMSFCMSRPWLSGKLASRLVSAYGSRIRRVLQGVQSLEDLGECYGADLYEAEVRYLIEEEWATTPEDILWRRTKLGLVVGEETVERLGARLSGQHALGPSTVDAA